MVIASSLHLNVLLLHIVSAAVLGLENCFEKPRFFLKKTQSPNLGF